MEGYQAGKDISELQRRVAYLEAAMQDTISLIAFNIESKALVKPPTDKKEE